MGLQFVNEVRAQTGWSGSGDIKSNDSLNLNFDSKEIEKNLNSENTDNSNDFESLFTTDELLKPEVLVAAGIVGSIAVAATIRAARHRSSTSIKNNPFYAQYKEILNIYGGKIEKVPTEEMKIVAEKLKELYVKSYNIGSVDSWRTQAKILDDIDFLHDKNSSVVDLIEYRGPPAYFGGVENKIDPNFKQKLQAFSPLIQFEDIDKVGKIDQKFFADIKSETSLFKMLAENNILVEREAAHGAAVIKWAHKPDSWFRRFITSNPFMNFLTTMLGKRYNKIFPASMSKDEISRSIAQFSLDMGITPGEAVRSEIGGKRFMRGANYLFGKPHDQFKSHNLYFVRDLTETARSKYLVELAGHEKALEKLAGVRSGSRYVVSAADARLSVNTLEPGKLNEKIRIFGKILSDSSLEAASKSGDISGYSEKRYGMTIPELFGLEYQEKRLTKPWESMPIQDLKSKFDSNMVRGAQIDLLGALYKDMNSDPGGVTMLKQRLAPADGHNFRFPVDGTPLSNLEAIEFLKERSAKAGRKTPAEEKKFRELIEIFLLQEKKLGRSSQSTIDIIGSHRSVSELGVRQAPNIISQNARKITILKHGNSFSVHAFIDASGVGKVYTDPESSKIVKTGMKQGNMQFGHDVYATNENFVQQESNRFGRGDFLESDSFSTRDGLRKLDPSGGDVGSGWGRFSMRGSTVVSLYFTDDFEMTEPLSKYQKSMEQLRIAKKIPRVPEIRVQAGDVLLQKRSEKLLVEILEELIPESTQDYQSLQKTIKLIREKKVTLQLNNSEMERFNHIFNKATSGSSESERIFRKAIEEQNILKNEIHKMDLRNFASGKVDVKTAKFSTYKDVLQFKSDIRARINEIRQDMRTNKVYKAGSIDEINKLKKLEEDEIITILRRSLR